MAAPEIQASSTPSSASKQIVRRWLYRNGLLLVTVIAVVSALAGTVVVVRLDAAEKDELRQAQIALAMAPSALTGTVSSPLSLLAGERTTPTELALNKGLRDGLTHAVANLNHFWHAPMARAIDAETAQINASTSKLMGLLARHRVSDANTIHDKLVEPLANKLSADLGAANVQLTRQTRATDQTAFEAMLGVVGVAALLLVSLLVGLSRTRSRRERTEVEQQVLRRSEQRLQALVEHGSDMITVVAPDTTVIYQAGAVGSMLGYEPGELEGVKLLEWLDPNDRASLLALCATERTASQELRLRHRDGSLRPCEVHATSLLDDPAWEGIVLNIWDLSERKALEERLRHLAFHDPLTGLPNRALVLDRAEQMLAKARRSPSVVAALHIDIDAFKHVNDSFGHAAGDQLLRVVGERLQGVVREQDTVGRLGGDEFVVLLESAPPDAPPELVAERIIEVLGHPIELRESGKVLSVSASVGISVGWRDSAEQLLRDADFALYEAKELGKDRYAIFEERMQRDAEDRLTLEIDLHDALAQGQLFLLYQPTFDLDTRTVIGVEALIRWRHPTRGVLPPDSFIPLSEQTGLIVPIGRWVLREACEQAARWRAQGYKIGMSVNVSAYQLDRDGLVEDVRGALEDSQIAPQSLTLEITETALMHDVNGATLRLNALKELGVRIAIDDFGTGYSSLAYLRQFPVDALKIDRSFISGIAASSQSAAIIHTLVQLGKTLSIETLAEGIEDEDQLEQLQHERCDHGQGFLFARPLDVKAVEDFLQAPPRRVAETALPLG